MKLILDPDDLTPKGKEMVVGNPTKVEVIKFDHLNEEAQYAVIAVGEGTLYCGDRHQRILAPGG